MDDKYLAVVVGKNRPASKEISLRAGSQEKGVPRCSGWIF